jgi:fatty acid desaturase
MWRCVVADTDYSCDEPQAETQPTKRGIDAFTLIAGLATLLISGYVLTDGASWMPAFEMRWVLAGGAVLIGVLMLAGSFSGGHKH